MDFEHRSVLPDEVHLHQNLKPGHICVDCTLGGAGHAQSTLKAILPDGILIGIDQDQDAINNAKKILAPYKDNFKLNHRNFSDLPQILDELGIKAVDSILLDLGFSLNQIRHAKRGFSFNLDEPLDMRMDTRNPLTAQTIVNEYSETELADIFFQFGEEKFSRRIAAAIVQKRAIAPITQSMALGDIVRDALPAKVVATQKIHPATRVFQALRIAVNQELERLEIFMKDLPDFLNPGGRVSIISFHSLEDRIVKQGFKQYESGCTCPKELPYCVCGFTPTLKVITRKPITATKEELQANPMSRSAKLRVAEKL